MKSEFNRLYWVMINSETIADGEYYVIHADHLHDFKMAIENYLENGDKIKELYLPKLGDTTINGLIQSLNVLHEDIADKLNEVIDKLNRTER